MSYMPWKNLDVQEFGEVTVVTFKTMFSSVDTTTELLSLADELGSRKILLNFKNVERLTSSELGRLIVLRKMITTKGGRLSLCNVSPKIFEVFQNDKLNKLFSIDKLFSIERHPEEDDTDENCGGLTAPVRPSKPPGGESVAMPHPSPE